MNNRLANLLVNIALALAVLGVGGSVISGAQVGKLSGAFLILIGLAFMISSIRQYRE